MNTNDLNLRSIRRERAALRERRNTGKSKELSAQAVYATTQIRKEKERKNHVAKDSWL